MQNSSVEITRAANHDKNYWREMITAWQKSDEHPKVFCARMNIKIGTFAHWRGVFLKQQKQTESKFVELQITKPIQEKLDEFVIVCPSGHKIMITSSLHDEQVERLFKLLGLTDD